MNIGDLFDSPLKVLIIAIVVLVLFGSRKMPDAARSLGRSMRILKSEVSKIHDDDEQPEPATQTDVQAQALAAPTQQLTQQQQFEQMQQQIRDLQQQQQTQTQQPS
jgi:sec-independent protein translocase protein TatA